MLTNEENIHLTTKVRPGIINIVENTQGTPDIIYPAVILTCEKTFNQGVGRSSRPWVTILEDRAAVKQLLFLFREQINPARIVTIRAGLFFILNI